MLMRFMTTMYLPRISARQANPPAWERADRALASQTILLAIAMQFGFVLIAPFAVPILYGPQFGIGLLAVCLVALLQTARFIRLWPVTVAMRSEEHTSELQSLMRISYAVFCLKKKKKYNNNKN